MGKGVKPDKRKTSLPNTPEKAERESKDKGSKRG